MDAQGRCVLDYRFESAGDFHDGRARVVVEGRPTYVDALGQEVLGERFDGVWDFSEGHGRVWRGGRTGFVDRGGRLVIGLEYDSARDFSEGLAAVSRDGRWGYVRPDGSDAIACEYERADRFSEGLAAVWREGRVGYVDAAGRPVIPARFDGAAPFSQGLAAASQGGRWGYIGRDGAWRLAPAFADAGPFHEERAWVGTRFSPAHLSCTYSCIQPDGAPAFEGRYGAALPFADGLAAVNIGGVSRAYARWGYLDATGVMRFVEATSRGRDRCSHCGHLITEASAHREGIARVRLALADSPGASGLAYLDTLGEVLWSEGLAYTP